MRSVSLLLGRSVNGGIDCRACAQSRRTWRGCHGPLLQWPVLMTTADSTSAEPASADRTSATDGGSIEPEATGRQSHRLAVLDGLRLFAALSVVFFHYVGQEERGWEQSTRQMLEALHAPASLGWLGVNLFFLISCFVICMSSWGRSLGAFFTSRVVRLYPAYWFAVVLTTAFVAVLPMLHGRRGGLQVLVNLTMLQTPLGVHPVDPVYWTLWVELHFYLLFALVVWRGVTYRRVIAFCLLWIVASVFATAVHSPAADLLVGPEYSGYFVAGVAMYLMYRFRPTLLLWGIV